MKQAAKRFLKQWLIPPGFLNLVAGTARSTTPGSVAGEERAILARNAGFNAMYAGRRCFVIGNGPSLGKQDLAPLAGEVTIVMKFFGRHPIIKSWQPTFWCLADPASVYTPEKIDATRRALDRAAPQAFFVPLSTVALNNQHRIWPPEKAHYIKLRDFLDPQGLPTPDSKIDLTQCLPGAPDSSVLATMIALALGCSPIYILGVDYDWWNHRTYVRHFYPEEDVPSRPDYLRIRPYSHELRSAIRCFSSHEALRAISLKRGQKIFNATEGGFLDAHPNVTLAEALAGRHAGLD